MYFDVAWPRPTCNPCKARDLPLDQEGRDVFLEIGGLVESAQAVETTIRFSMGSSLGAGRPAAMEIVKESDIANRPKTLRLRYRQMTKEWRVAGKRLPEVIGNALEKRKEEERMHFGAFRGVEGYVTYEARTGEVKLRLYTTDRARWTLETMRRTVARVEELERRFSVVREEKKGDLWYVPRHAERNFDKSWKLYCALRDSGLTYFSAYGAGLHETPADLVRLVGDQQAIARGRDIFDKAHKEAHGVFGIGMLFYWCSMLAVPEKIGLGKIDWFWIKDFQNRAGLSLDFANGVCAIESGTHCDELDDEEDEDGMCGEQPEDWELLEGYEGDPVYRNMCVGSEEPLGIYVANTRGGETIKCKKFASWLVDTS